MRARSLSLCLLAVSVIAACTPADDTPDDRATPQPTETEARLERVLCQVSAGRFGDQNGARKDLTVHVPQLQGPPVTDEAVVGPFKVALTFLHDGTPHLSFAVGRVGSAGYNLHGEMFQLATDDDGGVIPPDNQLGSGFTGTAHIRYPGRDMTLTRYCRAF